MAINISNLKACQQFELMSYLVKISTIGRLDHVGSYLMEAHYNRDKWLLEDISEKINEHLKWEKEGDKLILKRNIKRLNESFANENYINVKDISNNIYLELKSVNGNSEIISMATEITNKLPVLYNESEMLKLEDLFNECPSNFTKLLSGKDKRNIVNELITRENHLVDASNFILIIQSFAKIIQRDNELEYDVDFTFNLYDEKEKKEAKNVNQKSPVILFMNNEIKDSITMGVDGFLRLGIMCITTEHFGGIKRKRKALDDPNHTITLMQNIDLSDCFPKRDSVTNIAELFKKYSSVIIHGHRNKTEPDFRNYTISGIRINRESFKEIYKKMQETDLLSTDNKKKVISIPAILLK